MTTVAERTEELRELIRKNRFRGGYDLVVHEGRVVVLRHSQKYRGKLTLVWYTSIFPTWYVRVSGGVLRVAPPHAEGPMYPCSDVTDIEVALAMREMFADVVLAPSPAPK